MEIREKTPSAAAKRSVTVGLDILQHSVYCQKYCMIQKCNRMKRLLDHLSVCIDKRTAECHTCKEMIALCVLHARTCTDSTCIVPYCVSVQKRVARQNEKKLAGDEIETPRPSLDERIEIWNATMGNTSSFERFPAARLPKFNSSEQEDSAPDLNSLYQKEFATLKRENKIIYRQMPKKRLYKKF